MEVVGSGASLKNWSTVYRSSSVMERIKTIDSKVVRSRTRYAGKEEASRRVRCLGPGQQIAGFGSNHPSASLMVRNCECLSRSTT